MVVARFLFLNCSFAMNAVVIPGSHTSWPQGCAGSSPVVRKDVAEMADARNDHGTFVMVFPSFFEADAGRIPGRAPDLRIRKSRVQIPAYGRPAVAQLQTSCHFRRFLFFQLLPRMLAGIPVCGGSRFDSGCSHSDASPTAVSLKRRAPQWAARPSSHLSCRGCSSGECRSDSMERSDRNLVALFFSTNAGRGSTGRRFDSGPVCFMGASPPRHFGPAPRPWSSLVFLRKTWAHRLWRFSASTAPRSAAPHALRGDPSTNTRYKGGVRGWFC